jgi:hypothetical protein
MPKSTTFKSASRFEGGYAELYNVLKLPECSKEGTPFEGGYTNILYNVCNYPNNI